MTLAQALRTIWARLWIVLLTVLVAVAVAVAFYVQQQPSFTSTSTARLSASITSAALSGQLSGVTVDVDPALIASPTILDRAGVALGQEDGSLLYGAVSSDFIERSGSTSQVAVSASGPTADEAQRRASAAMEAYSQYVTEQIAAAHEMLETRRAAAQQDAVNYQQTVAANPDDPIAATALTTALSTLSTVNNQLTTLDNAGPPMTVLSVASPGTSNTTSLTTVLLLAAVCGLLVGVGLALIRDRFDDRLRGQEELLELTGRPSLGALSYDRAADRNQNRLPAATTQSSALGEDIRALRTTLQVLLPQRGAVLVITSVAPGEGKSFISANLAVAWARAGKRVILMDGDLRRPSVGNYLPIPQKSKGLADLLQGASANTAVLGTADIDALVVATAYEGLRVLPAGDSLRDPADVLALDAAKTVIAHLSSSADILLIDSPPSLVMADAALLASHADGVLLMTTQRRTPRTGIQATVQALTAQGATLLGAVANRSRRRMQRYYGSYYGYGYGSAKETNEQPSNGRRAAAGQRTSEDPAAPSEQRLRRHKQSAR